MNILEIKESLIRDIFSQMKYDKLTEKYIIPKEAYIDKDLSEEDYRVLEELCEKHNIELERMPKKIKTREINQLFKEYKEIKTNISQTSNKEEKEKLIKKRYEIRNKLATYYMEETIRALLKRYPDIKEREDYEDIYQTGYEELLTLIDQYDPEKNDNFSKFLHNYLVPGVIRKIGITKRSLSTNDNQRLYMIIKTQKEYERKYGRVLSPREISQIIGYPEKEVKTLLTLKERTNIDSIEALLENEEDNAHDKGLIIEETFEEETAVSLNKEYLIKIIETLPETQKESILLYLGFKDGKEYTFDEIGKIIGTTTQGARAAYMRGIETLKSPIRINTIKTIYDIDLKSTTNVEDDRALEIYLMSTMPKEDLERTVNKMHKKFRDILILYLGLNGEKEHSTEEISKRMNYQLNTVREKIWESLNELSNHLKISYEQKYQGTPREKNTHTQNMMFEYINKPKTKKH